MSESQSNLCVSPRRSRYVSSRVYLLIAGMISTSTACTDLSSPLPSGIINPEVVATATGAHEMYVAARGQFQHAFAQYIVASGLLTDELQAIARGRSICRTCESLFSTEGWIGIDARLDHENIAEAGYVYIALHGVRTLAAQAIGGLETYDAQNSTARRAELYALQGYAEVWLADFFCSGVPLSTYDFGKDYSYRPGSTTDAVYLHAVALFDTAISLGADSVPIRSLAGVGKARAWLALGSYDSARVAVQGIATDFSYTQRIFTCQAGSTCDERRDADGSSTRALFQLSLIASVGNLEGRVGYPFVSRNDPRTRSSQIQAQSFYPVFFPDKYVQGGVSALTVASGVEARLIEAEALMQKGSVTPMLTILNILRRGISMDTITAESVQDRGAQEDTLFAERAAWLFLSGHRQGDARRLVRRYTRPKAMVYPNGAYPAIGVYERNIDVRIPNSEQSNPYFTGCLNRD